MTCDSPAFPVPCRTGEYPGQAGRLWRRWGGLSATAANRAVPLAMRAGEITVEFSPYRP